MSQEPKNIDALIVGAGPCGIFQIFELGLLGIDSVIIDSMEKIGGQCSELYPDKPIYDIPGIPVCSAQELVDNLMEQIEPFNPEIHLGEEVVSVESKNENYLVTTSTNNQFITKTIFIAGGVGSFQARKIKLKGIDGFGPRKVNVRGFVFYLLNIYKGFLRQIYFSVFHATLLFSLFELQVFHDVVYML